MLREKSEDAVHRQEEKEKARRAKAGAAQPAHRKDVSTAVL